MMGEKIVLQFLQAKHHSTLPYSNQYVQSVAMGGGRISYCRSDVANGDILGCEVNQEGFFSKPQSEDLFER